MIHKKNIIPIFLVSVSFSALASTVSDSIPYGQQKLQAAFGYQDTRDSYTGAQSSVKAEEIDKWKGSSLESAIRGKLSGWYNGVIRGQSSPFATDALLVLDGIPMPFISLADLDPTTVAEVTILKDAAAKALYGPQGAQGVVLVTTKKGKNNSMNVSVSANVGIEKATRNPDMLNAYGQALLRNAALTNDGLVPKFTASQLNAFKDGTGPDNDWRDMYMDDMLFQKYNVQVGAGSEKVRFYINVGFARESGRYKATYDDKYNPSDYTNRFTVVSNLDVDITSWMRAFANTNIGVRRVNASYLGGTEIYKLLYTTPNWVEDGVLPDGSVITNEGYPNPLQGAINYSGVNQMTRTDLAANIGFDLKLDFITKGLSFKGIFGYSSIYNGIRGGIHDYGRVVYNDNTQSYVPWGSNVETPLSWAKGTTTNYYMDIQAMFNYHRIFAEDHSVDALVHYTSEDYRGDAGKWYNYAFILPTNRIQLAGEAKYGFKNRYFLQFDFNYSGSEMMAEGHQFHFSPTVSASWVPSEESWFKNDYVTYLKLRASYGGLYYDSLRDQDSRYLYDNIYRASVGGISGIYSGYGVLNMRRGNLGIGWEKSKQQNYGFDLGLSDKFYLNFDYWRTNQEGILLQSELTPTLGGVTAENRPFINSGKVFNNGIDLGLTYSTVLPCGLGITANGQMGWNKNHWVSADELSYADAGYAYPYRKTGYSIGQQWGYLVDGSNGSMFYNSQDEIDNSGLRYTGKQPRPGDLKFKDLNSDGIIDEGDYAPLAGVYDMPRIEYGASVQLDYKGFDLYLDFIGEGDRSVLLNKSVGVAEFVDGLTTEGVYMPVHQSAWTPERYAEGKHIGFPALSSSASSSLQSNSFYVSKLDYLRLRNATIGYSLPEKLISRMGMSKLRFYVSGQNLLTCDNMKFEGLDPEVTQIYTKVYRSFNFGLNINF